jgi:hypothetical protein
LAELPAIGPAVAPTGGINAAPSIALPSKPVTIAAKLPETEAVKPQPEVLLPKTDPVIPPPVGSVAKVEPIPAVVTAQTPTPTPAPETGPKTVPVPVAQTVPAVAVETPTINSAATAAPGFAVMDAPVVAKPAEPAIVAASSSSLPPVSQGPTIDGSVISANSGGAASPLPAAAPSLPNIVPDKPAETLAPVEPKVDVVATPAVALLPADPPKADAPLDLGSVIDAIDIPDTEKIRNVAPVDLKSIKSEPPKPKDAAKAVVPDKNAKASSPARTWVQIATGPEGPGLGFDYRRWAKKVPNLFANVAGYSAPWSKSRRLLVGPFADVKAAKKWEADFRKAGGDGFIWQSEAGTAVDPLKNK